MYADAGVDIEEAGAVDVDPGGSASGACVGGVGDGDEAQAGDESSGRHSHSYGSYHRYWHWYWHDHAHRQTQSAAPWQPRPSLGR